MLQVAKIVLRNHRGNFNNVLLNHLQFVRLFSVGNGKTPPDNYYIHDKESESEFSDYLDSIELEGGLDRITLSVSQSSKAKEVDDSSANIRDIIAEAAVDIDTLDNDDDDMNDSDSENDDSDETDEEESSMDPIMDMLCQPDLADHLDGVEDTVIPEQFLNYNIPWRLPEEDDDEGDDDFPDPALDPFIPNTAHEKFAYDSQGFRHCPGKLQRKGLNAKLECHLIDLDTLHFMDVLTLRNFLSDDSEIMPRSATGLCAKCQRKVAKTIKRGRNFGVLPHLGEYIVQDNRPLHNKKKFHNQAQMESKTIS